MRSSSGSLLVAGWKSVSLVDIYGHPSFTIWLCGCNLSCPFCHNWRITDINSPLCKYISIDRVLEEVSASKALVDYIHVTGGEPLLQYTSLAELLLEASRVGISRSLNSNLTLYSEFKYLAERGLVDHVATDLKVPPGELYGLPPDASERLWLRFLDSLRLIHELSIQLELRIPVYRRLTAGLLSTYLLQVVDKVPIDETTVVVNPLLGEPYVSPRDVNWSRENCCVSDEHLVEIVETVKSYGFSRVVVRAIPGFKS